MLKFKLSEREESDNNIVKKLNEEKLRLHGIIRKRLRNLKNAIMITKMKVDIEFERKDRKLTEETLLSLMEDIYNKLNKAS